MKKFIIVILSIILVLSFIGIPILINIKKTQAITRNDILEISNNYQLFSEKITEYNKIRVELNNYMENFYFETYIENEEQYLSTLNHYDQVMKDIQININLIDKKCVVIYKDSSINKICQTYQKLYEKLVNLYVTDISNYNSKIISYNDYKNSDIELYSLLYSDYIDVNKDNIYEGRVN